jgi:PAS domain S-box-containing protein
MAARDGSPEANRGWGAPGRQVIDRLRFILLVCVSIAALYAARELTVGVHALGIRFIVRLIGIGLGIFGVVAFRRPWGVRHARPLAIGSVILAYVITALSGMLGAPSEYATTAVLFVGAALTTATVIPWGVYSQVVTVLIGAASLAAAVLWADGSLGVLATDPGGAVAMAFALSVITAREFDRYRAAHQHELGERRRAEEALRRLNVHLEDRVVERTATLQTVNDRLAAEIAERRRTNEALRASEALLADTLDNSTAIVSLKDLRGRYLLVNREFERLLAQPRIALVGRRDADVFPPALAERLAARDSDVLRHDAPVSFEQELPLGDAPRSYVCVKFPLRSADGAPYGVGTMATDITMLKQLQEALRRHQDELAHVLRLHTIGAMTAALAHDINQPLCAITNYAQGGARRLRDGALDPAALLEAFDCIAREGLRAAQILRGIRSLVQDAQGEATALDVNALAGEALRVLEPQARRHGVNVRVEEGAGLPVVRGNPTQIEQVMVNLMLNGLQASAAAGGDRREVVLATTRRGDAVEVTVRDTGEGIAPGVAGRLFTPFVTTKSGGLGLGLAISRTIVENHGGRLWATVNPDAGSTFRFSLPAADPTDGDEAPHG